MVGDISLQSLRDVLTRLLVTNFAPDNRMPPEVWAEQVRRMKDGARFRWAYAPYLLKPFLSIFDGAVLETAMAMFSRAGKSEITLNAIGYCVDQDPRRILCLWDNITNAELWSKDNLTGELFDETPCLHYLGSAATTRTSPQTILHKLFPGGLIDIFGANVAGRMRRAKGSFLYADEIDAIVSGQTGEGDPLAIFDKRGDEYPDTIRVKASYPGRKGRSRIWSALAGSDWQQYFVTCVLCGGEPFVMDREAMLRFDREKPAGARLECPRCAGMLTDVQRHQMMMQGLDADCWRPTRPFTGRRGFQANALLWPHPVDPQKFPGGFLEMLARQVIAIDAAPDPEEARRVLVNTVDAMPYATSAERTKPKAEDLFDRRESYFDSAQEGAQIPEGVCYIAAGGDTQDDRLITQIVGWGVGEEAWVLGYLIEFGDTQKPDVYRRMRENLETMSFQHPLGPVLRVAKYCPDTRHNKEQGRAMCAAMKVVRAYPIVGVNGYGQEIITRSKKLKKAVWIVASVPAKQLLYSRFATKEPGPGYVHFPAWLDMPYFLEVTSEHEEITMRDGHEIVKFEKPSHVANEALDTFAYALAALRHGPPHINLERLMRKMREEAGRIEPKAESAPVPPLPPKSSLERTMETMRQLTGRPARGRPFASSWKKKW